VKKKSERVSENEEDGRRGDRGKPTKSKQIVDGLSVDPALAVALAA